jgi:hypothetical protein
MIMFLLRDVQDVRGAALLVLTQRVVHQAPLKYMVEEPPPSMLYAVVAPSPS